MECILRQWGSAAASTSCGYLLGTFVCRYCGLYHGDADRALDLFRPLIAAAPEQNVSSLAYSGAIVSEMLVDIYLDGPESVTESEVAAAYSQLSLLHFHFTIYGINCGWQRNDSANKGIALGQEAA